MKWISVEERTPNEFEDVLVWNNLKEWPNIGGLPLQAGQLGYAVSHVRHNTTHWMPLPAPPEVK